MKERIAAADMYADLFNVSLENAFLNLEHFHQQWMGQDFVKKTGIKALGDSVKLSFLTMEYNELNKKLAKSKNQDPNLLKAVEQYEQKLDQLRDRAPKVWQDDYVKMGGWQDVGQFLRGVGVSMGENAVQIGGGVLAAAAAATGVGLIGGAVGLSAGTAGLLTAGASRAAIMANTYNSTWGIKYREMTSAGIPHDIAINFAQSDAMIEGIIEGALGGVEAAGANAISRAVVPQAVGRATNRLFISGKMGTAAKRVLAALKEGTEEGTEEVLQAFSSGRMFNMAADNANAVREEKLRQIVNPLFADMREELEKELENHPEVDRKEWNEILDEAWDGGIAGFLTGLVLGIPIEITNYRHDVRAAQQLAEMAQAAPNEAVFKDMVENAKEHGFRLPVEGLKTDEETALLSDIYKVQQERLTPEQRAEKAKQAQDAEALAEVTDYRNTETVQRTEEYEDETGKKNQETITELARPNEKVYKENGKLEIEEYTDTNEDGSINGSFVAGDPRIDDDEDQSGANQYGYINYTKNGDTITIDEFKMVSGYENLRGDLWSQFTEKFGNVNYVWNPKHEQNIAIRDELIKNNPDGPKNGLNYNINNVSTEARQVAQRFQPYLKNSTPLETALAAELFNNFYRRRGESLNGAMHRLIGSVTNEASPDVIAAQREGKLIKGAIWFDKTAEGMKRIVYLNKNAADISTVIHETSHAVANDFTEAERNIAARALNGYKLKNGTTVYFEENGRQWTDEQHEAFAEAFENYLTNGTAPNEQIKTLFEKIKEFMKRIYQTMKGWTELSPKVEEFYKSLLSGELVDQARAETAAQTREESRREAQTEKTQNDTTEAENATNTPQDTNRAISPNATQSHTEAQQQRDQIINDPDIPLEEKTQAVFDAAGEALYQAGEYNPDENPIDYLKANGQRLTDTAERKRVIAEIEELAHLYPPETNRYLAPNGKASKLNHAQWYAVRTPSFKEWFGEWEVAANVEWVFNAEPVKQLDGTEFLKSETDLITQVDDFFKNIGGKVEREGLGIVDLTRHGIRDSIAHGIGRLKAAAFMAVPGVIQHGKIIDHQANWKGRGYDTYVIDAPITIGNVEYIAEVIIKQSQSKNNDFYLHEVEIKEKAQSTFKTATERSAPQALEKAQSTFKTGMDTGAPQASKLIITQKLKEVKGNVSKIIDENGEPLVVYHGSNTQFEIFNTAYNGAFFAPEKSTARAYAEYAEQYGFNEEGERTGIKAVLDTFLNIKNPLTIDFTNRVYSEVSKESRNVRKDGYDGLIAKNVNDFTGTEDQYIAFEPNQIKSATDNAGTFNPNNPSILFQTAEVNEQFNEELERFLEGKLEKGHIFKLGEPGGILQRTGFPAGQEIELSATRLEEKSKAKHHPFNPADLKNLVQSINEPVAVFAYGDRINAQNVIIEIRQNGKNYLVGIHFDQQRQGTFVSSIRGLFPKETVNWLNWINQGLLLYADIGKLQAVVAQQRTNPADVSNHNLEPIERLIRENAGVKDYFPNENVTLFQFGDREMLEEAADFEDGKAYRKYFVENYGMPEEIEWDWTEEEINAWFGELVDQARTETDTQTREEAHREAQTEKTENDTKQAENATTTPQDTARAISPTATQSHIEAHTEKRDAIINDPDIPREEKAPFVYDAAGEALYQAEEDDQRVVDVVAIDPGKIVDENGNKINLKNARAITDWLKKEYQGREITITDDGLHLTLTRQGLEASVKRRGEQQRQMYAELDRLIETAVYDDYEKGDKRHPKVEKQNIYYSAAQIGDKLYSVRIKIDIPKNNADPNYYKDHKITEIKIEPSLYQGSSVTGAPLQNEGSISKVSIAVLKGEVKPSRIESGVLFQISEEDNEYFKALESGDMEKAQKIVDNEARKKGYISTDEYRMQHQAPNSHDKDVTTNLANVKESGIVPDDYWTHPQYYQSDSQERSSFYAVKQAIELYKKYGNAKSGLWVYRAVPKDVKEDKIRNGDWVTPSRSYAEGEGSEIQGGYKIIAQRARLEDLWWDANSINELGYDDGKNYAYKNTKNNRKLFDTIVRDYEGQIVPPSKRFNYRAFETFFQTEDQMMEEAASWDSWEDFKKFTEAYGDTPQEIDPWWSGEQIDAWYKSFWENSKKAKETEEKAQGVPKAESTPADIDREFKEIIPGKLDDFIKGAKAMYNEDYDRWGAVDEVDEIERERQAGITDDLRKKLDNPLWTTAFKKKQGELDPDHRKKLLTMIKNSPREYRAIYAAVMEDDYFTVSPEDFKAEILKNKITDSRRDKIDSMTPEQLRKLEEDIGIEEVARKLRTGKLKLDDPDVTAYIKRLNEEVKQKEQELKDAEADREEDNKYIENKAVEIFLESWDKVLKAKEEINRSTKEFDRAVKGGERAAARIAFRKQRQAKASYDSIMKVLEELNETHNLELNIQAAIANEEIKEYAKSAKTQSTLRKNTAFDNLNEEYKDFKKSARTQATLQIIAAF
jgi:hypothetical protein